MIRGQIFSEMIWFRPKSHSCRPKVGVTDRKSELQLGGPRESEPNWPEKVPEFPVLLQKSTHKALLNPACYAMLVWPMFLVSALLFLSP